METALVTGAAGFIGSHLVDGLLDRGWVVRGLDDLSTGDLENLDSARESDSFNFIEGDVRDRATVQEAMGEADAVFHQAALASVPGSFEDPQAVTTRNCTGTATVMDVAAEQDVESVVVASSSAVYGSGEPLPKTETQPVSPESPYAASKYYTETVARQVGDRAGIDVSALRYFNVYGPRQDPEGEYAAVVPKFIDQLLAGDRPTIFGDGEQTRDFVFIQDGEKAVELRLDGETTLTQDLELAAGESETVEIQIDTTDLEVGEYEHSIWTEDSEQVGTLSLVEEIGELELTVLDTADERVEGAVVGGDGIDAQTDADGFVQMELEPGSYDLTVTFRGVEETITVEITAGELTEATVEFDAEEIAVEIIGFVAENTGGYISFDEETQEEAEEEGVEFPAGDVVLEGTVEDGWWESTDVSFATLDAGLADADVEAPSGLEGTFDYENGVVTAEGELEVTTAGETFSFEIAAITEDSGDLSGSSAFEETGGTAMLVDNEYTVEDETGALVDSILGLPVEEPGLCWLELPMEFEFEQ